MIPNRKSIDIRPLGATNQTRYGHYEGDTIVAPKRTGNTHSIAIVTERKTKLIFAEKIPSLSPHEMTKAMHLFVKEADMKSMTMDNGIENKDHESWEVSAFFADPHSPWQRGTNENTNGLIRQYFPKGTDFRTIPKKELQRAQDRLNDRPRRVLAYAKPDEMFIPLLTNKDFVLGG